MPTIINGTDNTAATPALTGTDTDTGVFFPAANTMAFSTGGTEQVRVDSAGLLQFNSGYGSVATGFGCRAWVNFNGAGTVAIRASGNVSSITDNGTGLYTINFTAAMPDANYSVSGFVRSDGTDAAYSYVLTSNSNSTKTTSALQISSRFTSSGGGSGAYDSLEVGVAIFR